MELYNCCPICLDSWDNAAYLCILQWAESMPECPLHKTEILSTVSLVQVDHDFEEHVVTLSAASSAVGHQAGGPRGHAAAHRPAAAALQPVEYHLPWAPVGGLQLHTWASLFHDHPALLQSLLLWVRQKLRLTFEN